MTGDEIRVKILEYEDSNSAKIVTCDGRNGVLKIKGTVKVKKDGYVSAWIIQETQKDNIVICGNLCFGKFSISEGATEKYRTSLTRLFNNVDLVTGENISILKGAMNRCLKHDQWDWYTTYMYWGYPTYRVMHQFVDDSVIARNKARERNINGIVDFRDMYCWSP